ncbi:NUDIX domain-containing protein [Streptoalloteichus hindustanus]|uniref:ADP-ribose pyrophosphatase YjhB, NUDIX family n=1 Tax=Streptoalloteichus hindustanus TaxID=2017 RepID=A0A1M4ZIG1_STRHI|nr:NUDIX domain-containing protein [Streptoalloteichus hindustanus]SHF17587.1 ADP-ribose pyrophosphatase YjhB, NUDIX family [Streptoalloteichus hindustanus]
MTEYVFDTEHDRYPVAAHLILIDHDGRVLLMRRAGTGYADGLLALPAGHVDLGETPSACAAREAAEELGIGVDRAALTPAGVMFRRSLEPRVDFFFTATDWAGEPEIREPHKCAELVWADPADLPEDALAFVGQAIANARTGRHFDEYGWDATT